MIMSFDGLSAAADSGIHLLLLLGKEQEFHQKSNSHNPEKKEAEIEMNKNRLNPKDSVLYKIIEREAQKQRTQKSKITCKI